MNNRSWLILQNTGKCLLFLSLALLLGTSCTSAQSTSSQDGQMAIRDTLPTLRDQIYSKVRDGNTAEALDLFEKTTPQDALLLRAQFERVHKDFSRGLIGFDDFAITLARIHSTEKYYQQGLVSEDQLDRLKLNVKFAILEMAE